MSTGLRSVFSADELTHLFDQIPAVVWVCDRDLRFTFSAGSALTKLGLQPHQVVGVSLDQYFGGSPEGEEIIASARRAFAGESSVCELQWLGALFESHIAPLNDGTNINGAIGLALDVTERIAMEEELLLNRYRAETASALFPVVHYVLDESGTMTITPEHRELFGLGPEIAEYTYDAILALVHPDDRRDMMEARRIGIETHQPYRSQFRLTRPDGIMMQLRVQATPIYDERGRNVRTIGSLTDITQEVQRQHEITALLQHDGVTGLPNRTYFNERLRHEFAFASGSSELMALALFDIDRFSRINDSLGHLAGDEYLRTIASRLRNFQEGSQDLVARIGGDEFGVLLRGAQRRGDLVRRIDALRSRLEEPVTIADRPLHVSVSAGVALYPYDASDVTLLQKADLALSHARSVLSGRTEYYDLMLAEEIASSVQLEHGLHFAIRDSQLLPYYQPIVDRDGKMTAVEALVRWNHPEFGLLTPSAFLDVAEESGLIVELGERVLVAACAEVASMRARCRGLRLNFNVSSRHLLSRRLIQFVGDVLVKSGLPREALQIEVTEQSLIADVSAGRRAIQTLRSLGVSVVIDDFGTGYNTLGYLKSYQVDGIKLDRTFIRDMLTDRYSRAICEGVMAMARSLELPVIAEGIETSQQRDAAISMGCAELQGFLYGRPSSAGTLAKKLELR